MSNLNYTKRKVQRNHDIFNQDVNSINKDVNKSQLWWDGTAGKAFRGEWESVKRMSSQLESKMEDLVYILNRLENNIERAERERRARLKRDRVMSK